MLSGFVNFYFVFVLQALYRNLAWFLDLVAEQTLLLWWIHSQRWQESRDCLPDSSSYLSHLVASRLCRQTYNQQQPQRATLDKRLRLHQRIRPVRIDRNIDWTWNCSIHCGSFYTNPLACLKMLSLIIMLCNFVPSAYGKIKWLIREADVPCSDPFTVVDFNLLLKKPMPIVNFSVMSNV